MSTDITNEEEQVELTEQDLEVIEEINQENEPEDTQGDAEEISGVSEEVDEPQLSQEAEPDESPGDDNLVKWANHYGINPDDYANEDALRRHVEATGRYYQQVQQMQQLQQQQQAPPQDTQGEQAVAKQFKIGLDEDYDEGLRDKINELAAEMQQHYDGQMAVLAQALLGQQEFISGQEQIAQSAQYKSELDSFNEAVGGIGNDGLFGESDYQDLQQGSAEAQNRERLYDQVLVLGAGYHQQGKQMPPMADLVNQAYRTVFSSEIDNQNRKSFNDRVRKQARRRLGSGSTAKKTAVPTDDPVDNPVLKEAFDSFLKENGDI
tara:strand:- start:59 stop:1021 length:963 start_codon:yes stop_codon:yes gene_type:complete